MSITADPKSIRALALDLDGTTLAPGGVLTPRTVSAIKACRQRGLEIIIATGRAIDAVEPYRASLGAAGPMIYFNGAVVAEMPGGKILRTTLLDIKAAVYCMELARETGVYYQVYFPPEPRAAGIHPDGIPSAKSGAPRITLMAEKDGPEREMYHKHTGILAELGDLKEALSRPGLRGCVKSMFLAEPEVQAMLRPKLDERFGKSVYIARTLRTFLEIMDAKVSKGEGLRFSMERRSLKPEEVIAFGDEENDLPMFEAAGFSAAPSNAKDSVKAAADVVIGSNAEDGVAAFLEEFFG
ncbi:MAG: Cof-type HAD-IIB family hydrolase [Treponema sp.]|nr:Cof-type HAD-IIB family hydrolase [Treponema sp.]